ncbi:MAG: hypothetical protein LBD46_07005 [Endomicrobium sp.]|jgi:hypothetical protein|nr:hypothetical protein [Endomicrobium sp.]
MHINISNIQIPYEDFLIRAGYKRNASPPYGNMEILISETFQITKMLIKPKAAVVFADIKITENVIDFKGGFGIKSISLSKLLNGCFKAYGVAVTIGSALEKKRNDLISKKETSRAFLLDCAGSVAAEEAIKSANLQIKQFEETQNNMTTKRFSPGYGDWKLDSQKEFLKWIGAGGIGIFLGGACQMIPEKSVSAIIGVSGK